MKCPICGTEVPFGQSNCPGCGNFINQKASGTSNSQYGSMMSNNLNYTNTNPQFGFNNAQFSRPAASNNQRAVIVLVIVAIIVAVVFVARYVLNNGTKEYTFKDFSITLSKDLKKVSNSKFASTLTSMENFKSAEAGEYESNSVRFAYCVFEENTMLEPSALIELFAALYKTKDGYKELSHNDDTLKFTKDDSDGDTYCHIKACKAGKKTVIIFLVCNKNKRSTYEGKFDDWMDSFKAK